MSPAKTIVGFFVRAGAFYALLLSPWHGLMDAYRVAFRAMGNAAFARLAGGAAGAQFLPLSSDPHGKDTSVRSLNRQNKATGSMELKSGFLGFRPTAFFVALVLATPVPWSRRGIALLTGGVAVSAFVLFRVWLQLADGLSEPNVLDVYHLSLFWKTTLRACLKILVFSPAPAYIVTGLVWVLVTFRRGDWERLQGGSDAETDPPQLPDARGGRGGGAHRHVS